MLATYHTHSTWSDGKSSVAEMIAWAAAHGVDELGISDHYVAHPEMRRYAWSIAREGLATYADDVLSQAARATITVRLGLEVDWFPGQDEVIRAALAPHPFEYLIGSVHEVEGFIVDGSPAGWSRLSPAERDEVHRGYWLNVAGLAASGLFDVMAHLDLTKKFGQTPRADLGPEIGRALDAIAAAGLVVEVNTAGWHKPCGDAYPSLPLLRQCRDRGIPATLSSDAHRCEHLVRDFDRGADRLREAGYDQVARFKGRARWMERL